MLKKGFLTFVNISINKNTINSRKCCLPVLNLNRRMSDRESYLNEKRKVYKCGPNFKTLEQIPTWRQQVGAKSMDLNETGKCLDRANDDYSAKVSYFEGDITTLEIGAIVNAANRSLLGGGGVDGCIHRAAGAKLKEECRALKRCDTGDAKITKGYDLPCDFVIHTVGPTDESSEKLKSCYEKCFEIVKQYNIKSVAFPCIATGIYGFPNEEAARIALSTTKTFLQKNEIERVVFCVFTDKDKDIYKRLLPEYFQ